MISKISIKDILNIQFLIFLNVVFELLATAIIGVSISNIMLSKAETCFLNICFSQKLFFSFAFIFLIIYPFLHGFTLYKVLKKTTTVGMSLSNQLILNINKHSKEFSGIPEDEKLKITTIEAQRITTAVISPAARVVPSILTTIIILIFCLFQEPSITAIVFGVLTTYYVIIVLFTKRISNKISLIVSKLIANRFSSVRALIQNASFFTSRSEETHIFRTLEKQVDEFAAADALGQMVAQAPRKGLEAVIVISLIVGVSYFQVGRIAQSDTVAILAILTLKVLPNFQAIYHSTQQIRNNLSAYLEASKYLDYNNDGKAIEPYCINHGKLRANQIDVVNLCIPYVNEEISYRDLEFDLSKLNVISGPSGCGKSSLLKAISQQIFYYGSIVFPSTIDQEKIVYYGQSQSLLPGTLLENLCPYHSLHVSEAQLDLALDRFRVNQIMTDHNIGLDSVLLTTGNVNLSDGQKQRVLLARTFLSDADLILLDEPTSNLDAFNTELILDAIRSYSKTRNIIMTSHDISKNSDCELHIKLD